MTGEQPRREARERVLGPLVKLLLDVRLVALLGVILTTAAGTLKVALVLLLMAGTSALPVLLWRQVGAWIMRHPLAFGADLAAAVVVLLATGAEGPFPLYVVSTALLAGALYGRAGGLLLSTPLLLAYGLAAFGRPELTFISTVLVPVLLPGGALLGAELRRLLLDREAALAAAGDSLRAAATAEERARLARELHDSVAKTLHGIALHAASLPAIAERDPQQAAAEAERIRAAAEQASAEARGLLRGLREDDPSRPFVPRLRAAVDEWAAEHGLVVDLSLEEPLEPDPAVRHELFQILRECFHNVANHARASRIQIVLRRDGGGLDLRVTDDGDGFEMPQDTAELSRHGHFGLIGMQERAAAVGGRLSVESRPGAGCHVRLHVPARESQEVAPT